MRRAFDDAGVDPRARTEHVGRSRPEPDPSADDGPVGFARGSSVQGEVLCGRYQIVCELARGGSAVVYRALDRELDLPVAVKVLARGGLARALRERSIQLGLRDEALAALRLSHPNVLRVFNYERHGQLELLVMELIEGEHLGYHVSRRPEGRLDARATIDIALACLDGLAYAHAAGVIHNDLKPGNVLVTDGGHVKLCDFGLARIEALSSEGPRCVIGTPAFISPERVRQAPGDARSDIYSLAAMLYTVGNGDPPFGRGDAAMLGHLHEPLPPSRHLPGALHDILAEAMAKDPADRWPSAAAMRAALAELAAELAAPSTRSGTEVPITVELDGLDVALDGLSGIAAAELTPTPETGGMVLVAGQRLASRFGGEHEVASFWLDRTPVTSADYALFLAATSHPPPEHWLGGRVPAGREDHPVVGVSRADARAYAAWRGRRLPTCLELETAAREGGRRFPWGDELEPGRFVGPPGCVGTRPVSSFPEGAAASGAVHLVGNVWQWCEDTRAMPAEPGFAWVMGGSYRHAPPADGVPRTAVAEHKTYDYLGFRCAADADDRNPP